MLKDKGMILVVVFILALPALSMAGTVDMPETGQTTCYDPTGDDITCLNTGQDGETLVGVPWPSPRFTDNGDGTVTDNLTGLTWLKNANCFGTQTWANVLNAANTLNSGECGLSDGSLEGDWRLPNVNELESLINAEETNTATWLNAQGFTNVQSDLYWSSSTFAGNTARAWRVNMWYGFVLANVKTGLYYVWPVRAATTPPAEIWETGQTTSYATGDDGNLQRGVEWPLPRFTDNGDGTVTDNLTGLTWLKNANCFGTRTWTEALSDANNLLDPSCGLTDGSAAGYWRLPNRKELHSLTDFSQSNPALPSGHPFANVQSDIYWSSSTYAFNTARAWIVYMWNGNVYFFDKPNSYYVWPVRAGTSDILVTKTDDPDPVVAGNNITYTIEITNNGPETATGVTLMDTLPAGTTFVSASSTPQGTCSEAGGTVTCDIGGMANGATVTVTIVVTANTTVGTITNTADVSGTNIEVDPSDNTVNEGTTVHVAIPTMTEWGMIIFMVLAGLGSIYYLRRKSLVSRK